MLLNGCDEATAEDHLADAKVQISFGGAVGFKYAPKCIVIKSGTTVTFSGDFASHPLAGGVDGTKDPSSPITATNTGMSKDFVIAAGGAYGYYCEFHQAGGMKGAIFVKE
jgi:plastocyanin